MPGGHERRSALTIVRRLVAGLAHSRGAGRGGTLDHDGHTAREGTLHDFFFVVFIGGRLGGPGEHLEEAAGAVVPLHRRKAPSEAPELGGDRDDFGDVPLPFSFDRDPPKLGVALLGGLQARAPCNRDEIDNCHADS